MEEYWGMVGSGEEPKANVSSFGRAGTVWRRTSGWHLDCILEASGTALIEYVVFYNEWLNFVLWQHLMFFVISNQYLIMFNHYLLCTI